MVELQNFLNAPRTLVKVSITVKTDRTIKLFQGLYTTSTGSLTL